MACPLKISRLLMWLTWLSSISETYLNPSSPANCAKAFCTSTNVSQHKLKPSKTFNSIYCSYIKQTVEFDCFETKWSICFQAFILHLWFPYRLPQRSTVCGGSSSNLPPAWWEQGGSSEPPPFPPRGGRLRGGEPDDPNQHRCVLGALFVPPQLFQKRQNQHEVGLSSQNYNQLHCNHYITFSILNIILHWCP